MPIARAQETRCAAHRVQNAVGDVLQDGLRSFLNKLRKTVDDVRSYMDRLPATSGNIPMKPKKPSDTRWGSEFTMVRIN